jgi:hypothetical protein
MFDRLSPEDQVRWLEERFSEPNILTWARAYLEAGLSVVPIRPDAKYPAVTWKEFQERRATELELEQWFSDGADRRIGIVTGAISGVFVLDVDYRHGGHSSIEEELLAATAIAIVVSPGGRHYWFRYPTSRAIKSKNAWRPGVDRKAQGGITLIPPSPNYRWEKRYG